MANHRPKPSEIRIRGASGTREHCNVDLSMFHVLIGSFVAVAIFGIYDSHKAASSTLIILFHSISVLSVPCDRPVMEIDNPISTSYIVDMSCCVQGVSHEYND